MTATATKLEHDRPILAPAESLAPSRVGYLDGLRGLASLSVAWFHLYSQNGLEETRAWLGPELSAMFIRGRFGVYLFFCLSGFVLALTLIKPRIVRTVPDIGRYLLRRSVRLDLPYWVATTLYLTATAVIASSWVPTPYNAFSSYVYFLPVFGDHALIPVVWTLVLEVQFYLLFAAAMLLSEKLGGRATLALATLALACIPWQLGLVAFRESLAFPYLGSFLLGVCAYAWLERLPGARWLTALVVVPGVYKMIAFRDSAMAASFIAILAIFAVARTNRLRELLSCRVATWLGHLSYGTYLLHSLVGKLVVEPLNALGVVHPAHGFVNVVIGLAATLAFAHVFWRFIERPSITLSKRVKLSGHARPT